MAYNKEQIFESAKEIAVTNNCLFIEELVSYLPISKATFYLFFPDGSDELDEIKGLVNTNKEQKKSAMYRKWFESDNATLQISLMKLISTEEQAHRLNGSSTKVEHSGSVNISPKEWV